ncbi:serine/threonine dehydratase [Thermaurantimonas aggregans]|uniref:Serine/threonine dehydratase n=1 Tax=Thermaurantimonas aggregans TaxID=2173829 RepID=A0A401XIP6_9FLAO|nr:threonine/serine dehydratase [Thermaurantimonas aggregans]MCX8148819.1 threonine/serine dehydratase [Thermaurantimonas aggregans]GCD76876.1 serine/threonine dehydratase [Thermaurantimonas aggregans]
MKINIAEAHHRINNIIIRTPLITDDYINNFLENTTFFKCENLQKIHAFKARGAANALSKLQKNLLEKGVATHSSGNHGQALAWAAKIFGTQAHVVMPMTAPKTKVDAVRFWGGEITFCEPTLQAREETLQQVVERTGAIFIPPYNHWDIIEGQGTCAFEILQEGFEPDFILAPVGGGGLLSGTALAAHQFSPKTKVIGCEPKNADDAYQSFHAGKLIPVGAANTIADGLRTSLGDITFDVIRKYVHDILTVTEEEVIDAWRWITFYLKLIIEPSCAVPVAALLKHKDKFKGKKVAVILTGGNVDAEKLRLILP